jgi:heptosyltransferase I
MNKTKLRIKRLVLRPLKILIGICKVLFHFLGTLAFRLTLGKPDFQNIQSDKSYNILYVSLWFRGDLILSLPTIDALKRRFPNSKISCWVRGFNEPLARMHPTIDNVIVYDDYPKSVSGVILNLLRRKNDSVFINQLKRFDIYIDDSGAAYSAVAGYRAKIPYRIGRNSQAFGFLYHFDTPNDFNMQLIERRLKLLEPFGERLSLGDIQKPFMQIAKDTLNITLLESSLLDVAYFTVQPYAGWAAKNWGLDKYCYAARQFAAISKLMPVFIGSSQEKKLIAESIDKHPFSAINLAGSVDIDKAAMIIAGAQMHLGGDSVGGQISVALGIKSVTVFGPTHPTLSAYLGGSNIGVYKRTKCTPKDGKIYCCFDAGRTCTRLSCMKELEADDVLQVMQDLWQGKRLPPAIEF